MVAEGIGQSDIRGLDIDKLVKGFADEEIIMKKHVTVTPTSAREIRWYQKTAGFIDSEDTSGITASQILTSSKSLPVVVNQTWTRQTSYVKKFFAASELISEEDLKDNDVDVLATLIRDIVRGVERQVDFHIINTIAEDYSVVNIQTIAITNEWDDYSNQTCIEDLAKAREYLKNYNYEPNGAILLIRPDVERFLLNYLISVKGSSIPNFASSKVENAVLLEILGFKVITSTLVTSDYGIVFVPQRACTFKQFMPISSATITDEGIGKTIRVWEEGVALLTDPKSVVLFSNIGPS